MIETTVLREAAVGHRSGAEAHKNGVIFPVRPPSLLAVR